MRFTLFCHSLVSDWNHGNAHFLRGIVRELQNQGHEVDVLEPEGGWSMRNLLAEHGRSAVEDYRRVFGQVHSRAYDPAAVDLDAELAGADVILVHDWNEPSLVAALGERRRRRDDHRLLFYDAHHRAVSAPQELEAFRLEAYDGVLAFGAVIRDLYLQRGWARRAWVWHEAADTALFKPQPAPAIRQDLVWIGNWGDGERSAELREYLLEPVTALGLGGHVHGVRYPAGARRALADAGLRYEGWLPNHRAPDVFAAHRVTVHVPRRAYVRQIPGVPTIRVFEALACGIPLICAPWDDREGLFRPGQDYLVARDGTEMRHQLARLLNDSEAADAQVASGLQRIRERHSCAHRAQELLGIVAELGA